MEVPDGLRSSPGFGVLRGCRAFNPLRLHLPSLYDVLRDRDADNLTEHSECYDGEGALRHLAVYISVNRYSRDVERCGQSDWH